ARSAGASCVVLEESVPLGTIGACGTCVAKGDLVVINVDNLTTLDLNFMLEAHRRGGAAMTVATHRQTFRIPFGQVLLDGRVIRGIIEKPETTYDVSSGSYVLSERARRAIPPRRAVGAPELVELLTGLGEVILAFPHGAPWIDVNDAVAVKEAETLIARHSGDFDCPW